MANRKIGVTAPCSYGAKITSFQLGNFLRESCDRAVSDNRKRKAIDLFKVRYGREPQLNEATAETDVIISLTRRAPSDLSLLIGCTNLVDKATMIWKQRLIPPAKQADVLGFFNDLKEIRDGCAHPGLDAELLPKERLAHFVNSAKRIRGSLLVSLNTLNGEISSA